MRRPRSAERDTQRRWGGLCIALRDKWWRMLTLRTNSVGRKEARRSSVRWAAPLRAGRLPPSVRPLCDDGRRWRERGTALAQVPKTQRHLQPTTRCGSRARAPAAPLARPMRSVSLGVQALRLCPCQAQTHYSASRVGCWAPARAPAGIRPCSTRLCEQPRRELAREAGLV